MRKLFELLDAKIEWDPETSTVTAAKQEFEIKTTINQTTGSTFVPARFIAESFGAAVNWDEVTHTVKMETK